MKERINKLARGIVDLDQPELKLSAPSFEGTVNAGEVSRFDLILVSENGIQLKGLVYSDNPYVTTEKTAFLGSRTRLNCDIDTRRRSGEGEIDGNLLLVSNAGELKIPYHFTVKGTKSREVIQSLKTSKDYVDLFREHEDLAQRIFVYDDFCEAPFLSDSRLLSIYEGLRNGHDLRVSVIEFIRALGYYDEIKGQDTGARRHEILNNNRAQKGKTKALYDPEKLKDPVATEEEAQRLIRDGVTSPEVFPVFEKAVSGGSKLTRLYEFLVQSMPDCCETLLPREVYLYFSLDQRISEDMKRPLYYNILSNFKQGDDIYERFEHDIQEYAIGNLLAGSFDRALARIYERMILPDMIDEKIAGVLPGILNACRIEVSDPDMQYVVLRYQELSKEEIYPLRDGEAYIPVYFDNALLLFQDAYGCRYTRVTTNITRLMNKPSLEERCFKVLPSHPMLKLRKAIEILSKGPFSISDIHLLESCYRELPLAGPFRRTLVSCVLRYMEEHVIERDKAYTKDDILFLSTLPDEELTEEERATTVAILLKLTDFNAAFDRLSLDPSMPVTREVLETLTRKKLQDSNQDRELLMTLCLRLFHMNTEERDILGFLLKNFNGLSQDMLLVLRRGIKAGSGQVNIMAERLLGQMLFTGEETGLDEVYQIYRDKNGSDMMLIRAYITRRCIDYFLHDREMDSVVFKDLFHLIREESMIERVPLIMMLGFSRYEAGKTKLTGEEKLVLQDIVDYLVSHKYIFAYTKKLSKFIHVPDSVMSHDYIEYHGDKDVRPSLYVRVLPDEADFEEREIERVYQNIYVRPVTLFSQETMEYQVYDSTKGPDFVESGSLTAEAHPRAKGDTYDILNEMSGLIGTTKDKELLKSMLRYVRNEAVIDELFVSELKEQEKG